mgnify:CR=1 FL=1
MNQRNFSYIKDIILILDKRDRSKFFLLLILIFIGAILETTSIALVIPLLKVILDGKLFLNNIIGDNFDFLSTQLSNLDISEIVFYVILLVIIIFFLKFLYLLNLSWLNAKYNSGILRNISTKLFKKYINNSYSFHVNNNSSNLIENVNGEVNMYCGSVIAPFFVLITEILISLFLFSLVLFVDFFSGMVITILISLITIIYYFFTKKKIDNWGILRQKHALLRMQHLQQGFMAIKDIKLFKSEKYFTNKFDAQTNEIRKVMQNSMFVISVPRLGLEFLLILGMSIFLILNSIDDDSIRKNIPTLGLFAAAAFRVMPSLNRILGSLQELRYAFPVVKRLKNHLKIDEVNFDNLNRKISFENEIKLENINFHYNKNKPIFQNLSLKIKRGDNVGIIGSTGSGKTTLVNLLLGLLKPIKGNLYSDNVNIQENLKDWYDLVGFVPQFVYLTDDTIKNNIAFGKDDDQINIKRLNEVIKLSNLDDFIFNLRDGFNSLVGERGVKLSGGQIQRIGIARALYKNPEILILDEPTSALDSNTEQKIINEVNKLDNIKTKILISHRASPLDMCNKIIKIDNSKIKIIK